MCHQTPLGDHGQGDKTNPVYMHKERRCQVHIETNIKSIKKDRLLKYNIYSTDLLKRWIKVTNFQD